MTAGRIRRLTPDLINKIAAGEVVERPASVVKELVENAIDAEASRIDITLEEGGKKLIRVMDDGVGMSPADLGLAFESHATSKLADVDELFEIHTLGFRGEALASIASVSRCRILSRERGADGGNAVESLGGRVSEVKACGAPEGTLIEVRDLFFNTPARLKFLRTTTTEVRHATEAVMRLALPHPALEVNLFHKKKALLRLPSCEILRQRIAQVFGDTQCDGLLPVHSETAAMTVTGFATPPGEGLASSRQYVFLNGRYIRDRAIGRAIAESYRSRLMRGRYPGVFLNLQLDPGRVDVNVHPTKIEVRFRDAGAVFAQVLAAIEKALRMSGPPATRVEPSAPESAPAEREQRVRQAMADFFEKSANAPEKHPREFQPHRPYAGNSDSRPASDLSAPPAHPGAAPTPVGGTPFVPDNAPVGEPSRRPPESPTGGLRAFCQIHDSYIIEEVAGGFTVIDQHALHERILYEELKSRADHAAVPRQRLLVPEVVDLSPSDILLVQELSEDLLRLGIEVASFGEKTVAVHAVPHLAKGLNPRELLVELLKETQESIGGRPGNREETLMRVIACKAAVRAGDRLSRAQVSALLEQRDRIGPEPTCPHGRPTTLRFDLPELERRFRRT